ncbi:MAG: T9SS type A sorting domain-containing protein [Bacteroidetes bacterium]|nr:T9SS type A sorting domain-containing protein [Bacteroidota bacterium]
MKKIYSTLALSAMFFGAFAQQLQKVQLTANPVKSAAWLNTNNTAAKTAVTSTLMPTTLVSGCGTNSANIVYYSNFYTQPTANYTVVGVGYGFGSNLTTYNLGPTYAAGLGSPTITIVADKTAQKYNVTGFVSVTDVLVASAIGEGTGSISAKIYSENATTKGPNAQIGGTATKALNTLTGYDALTFATPVALSAGNFFASIETPAIGGAGNDTLAILSTAYGCSSTDSLSWISRTINPPTAAAAVGGSGWVSFIKSSGGTAADNLDFLIFPVVNITTGLNSISKGNLTLLAAFPNPAANEISINFGLSQSSKVEVEIYDVTGKIVNTIKLENLEAGNHTTKVNTSSLNSGVYMYSVKSDNAKMFSKFTIAK